MSNDQEWAEYHAAVARRAQQLEHQRVSGRRYGLYGPDPTPTKPEGPPASPLPEGRGAWLHLTDGSQCPEQFPLGHHHGMGALNAPNGSPWWCTTHQSHLVWAGAALPEGRAGGAHDEQCESEFIEGPMSMSPCGCADRRAMPEPYASIHAERLRAHAKHAETSMESQPVTDPEGARRDIVTEEWGEVAREFNEARHGGRPVDLARLRSELVQTAAMVSAWVAAIDGDSLAAPVVAVPGNEAEASSPDLAADATRPEAWERPCTFPRPHPEHRWLTDSGPGWCPGQPAPVVGEQHPLDPEASCLVHFSGGPWEGQILDVNVSRVVAPVFAVGHHIGGHYWLDRKSDPPTYVWDGAPVVGEREEQP